MSSKKKSSFHPKTIFFSAESSYFCKRRFGCSLNSLVSWISVQPNRVTILVFTFPLIDCIITHKLVKCLFFIESVLFLFIKKSVQVFDSSFVVNRVCDHTRIFFYHCVLVNDLRCGIDGTLLKACLKLLLFDIYLFRRRFDR